MSDEVCVFKIKQYTVYTRIFIIAQERRTFSRQRLSVKARFDEFSLFVFEASDLYYFTIVIQFPD